VDKIVARTKPGRGKRNVGRPRMRWRDDGNNRILAQEWRMRWRDGQKLEWGWYGSSGPYTTARR